MSGDLGALAFAALGIALSPLPFVLAVALLGTGSSPRTAAAFVTGQALAVGTVSAAAVFLVPVDEETDDSLGTSLGLVELTVGVLIALLRVAHLRRSSSARSAGWWSRLARVGPRAAFGGGLAMVVVNPKNLALTLAGAAAIIQLSSSTRVQAAGVVTFATLAVAVLLLVVLSVMAFPQRSRTILDRVHGFVLDHERTLVTILLGAVATFFVARGALAALA